jgi:cation diffusion facilitator family transporter
MAYFSVKYADNPPDRQHPYGHGKFENISGVVEALLIFAASGWIIFEAIKRIINPEPLESFGLTLGFGVMVVSSIVNLFVSRILYRVSDETDSIALRADALHLKTHIYTSAGIAVAMVIIWITGWSIVDSIAAIAVALIILFEASSILKSAFLPLIDSRLSEEDINLIQSSIESHLNKGMTYHALRTRKSGSYKFADFHLELPEDYSVKESHDLCDTIEKDIKQRIAQMEVTIHVEPKDIHG